MAKRNTKSKQKRKGTLMILFGVLFIPAIYAVLAVLLRMFVFEDEPGLWGGTQMHPSMSLVLGIGIPIVVIMGIVLLSVGIVACKRTFHFCSECEGSYNGCNWDWEFVDSRRTSFTYNGITSYYLFLKFRFDVDCPSCGHGAVLTEELRFSTAGTPSETQILKRIEKHARKYFMAKEGSAKSNPIDLGA